MQKLHFSQFINAPVEKVWNTMLDAKTYGEWTSAFNPGGHFKGNWDEGSKMLFLGPNPDGTSGEGGMVSRIKINRPNEYISIEHIGMYINGVEDTTSAEVKKWTPAYENYTFTEKDGGTLLEVDMDITDEEGYAEMFNESWPKALLKLKEICEA